MEELNQALATLNRITGKNHFTIEKHYNQGSRVMATLPNKKGETKVSPILPRKALVMWIEAYISGYEARG